MVYLLSVNYVLLSSTIARSKEEYVRYNSRADPGSYLLKDIERILIVKLSSIGDVVHSLPTLKALRDAYPQAYIAWVVEEKSKDIITDNPLLDEVIIFEKERWKKELFKTKGTKESLLDVYNFAKTLREKKFDAAIDLQGLLRSSLIAYFSGAKIRVGYRDSGEMSHIFYNLKVDSNESGIHAVDRHLYIAKFLGANINNVEFPLWISKEERNFAKKVLSEHNISRKDLLIGLNAGASIQHNRWDKERFAKLGDILIEKHEANIILFGGKQDVKSVQEIYEMMRNKPINLAGKTTMKQLASIIEYCNLFIGNDTGPLHIAVAMKVPVVAIFGPADPKRTGPYGKQNIVVYKKLSCSPCFRHPTCSDFKCMKLISVEEVLEAAERLLSR